MMVQRVSLPPPPVRIGEVLRYSGMKTTDDTVTAMVDACVAETLPLLRYDVCYTELPLTIADDVMDLGVVQTRSASLAKRLRGCDKAVLFAATIGIGCDRLITKYQTLSPARAVILQALGAERIESLCDAFCAEWATRDNVTPRFSPGYGDWPLAFQKEVFSLLDCPRKIGLTLNGSLLMSPSKSVTAIIGIGGECRHGHGCAACENTTCEFRRRS